jgi:hypothetical protein
MHPERVYPSFTQSARDAELSARLLDKVSKLDHQLALLQSIRVQPDPALNRAILGIESSAWRGKGGKHAQALLARTTRYVNSQLNGISIRGVSNRPATKHVPYHVTFGGKTASVNVVVHNALRYKVQVGLLVQAEHVTVTGQPHLITIPPESYSGPVTLTVHVQAKHGTIRLSLISPKGSPLPANRLVIRVHATNFGTFALAIFAIALGLFVTASAFRAIRNGKPAFPSAAPSAAGGWPDDPSSPAARSESARPASPDDAARAALDDPARSASADEPARSASGAEPPGSHLAALPSSGGPMPDGWPEPASELPAWPRRHRAGSAGPDPASSPSAWIVPPGLHDATARDAAIAQEGFPDLGNRPEYTDSVGGDGSEPTSAGPSVLDEEPVAPSRRATEEPR